MKVFWCIVCFLILFVPKVMAGATSEIVEIDIDANGNIGVWTHYKVDGVEVESRYPKKNGKAVYYTRYHALNFYGMNDAEIKQWILDKVNNHTKTLIKQTYVKKKNLDIKASHMANIVGTKTTLNDTKVGIDTDGDGQPDKELTLKTDGTYTEQAIIGF